jgi:hypothetical protein
VWATSKEPVAVWVRAVSMKIEVGSIQKWNKGLMISETHVSPTPHIFVGEATSPINIIHETRNCDAVIPCMQIRGARATGFSDFLVRDDRFRFDPIHQQRVVSVQGLFECE